MLSYKDAGVDIEAGNMLVDSIKPITKKTHRTGVMGGLGGFGALFELPLNKYDNPVLVSGTDGVGTKLKLALAMNKHDTIGIDLVAMSVNDIIVSGAEPLFFLDYYASGKLDVDIATDVIRGISDGCIQAGCALTGGETAEMPDMYSDGDYDLAGFCVGIVEKNKIIDGSKVKKGDVIIGIESSGPHSNGYSLIRKILERSDLDLDCVNKSLLEPTKIYVKPILSLIEQVDVHSLCHITGGGLLENIPRVLPNNTMASINESGWVIPDIFEWLRQEGDLSYEEMYRTFNCGIGMVVIVDAGDVESTMDILQDHDEFASIIGIIKQSKKKEPHVEIT